MKIWANTIVHNEENFIWFALMSVVDYVDKVLIWDTGSEDRTVEIIQEVGKLKKDKINFREVGSVDKEKFTKMRQAMLEESECDWILILDGDEIWWEESIKKLTKKIRAEGENIDGIAVPFLVPVGDIYHLQDESAGRYELLGRRGNLSLKAINRKIKGLHVGLPYGQEGYFGKNDVQLQKSEKLVFVDAPFLHVTFLQRSNKLKIFNKVKSELGKKVANDFIYPEVFLKPFPKIVPSPWRKLSLSDLIKAKLLTPLRKAKRRFL